MADELEAGSGVLQTRGRRGWRGPRTPVRPGTSQSQRPALGTKHQAARPLPVYACVEANASGPARAVEGARGGRCHLQTCPALAHTPGQPPTDALSYGRCHFFGFVNSGQRGRPLTKAARRRAGREGRGGRGRLVRPLGGWDRPDRPSGHAGRNLIRPRKGTRFVRVRQRGRPRPGSRPPRTPHGDTPFRRRPE